MTRMTAKDTPRLPLRLALGLMAAGGIGGAVLSRLVYDGDVVFPALVGACFGLAVAATGKRRMAIGANDVRSRRVQRFYAATKPQGDGDGT